MKKKGEFVLASMLLALISLLSCNDSGRIKNEKSFGPTPSFVKAKPITMDELGKKKITGLGVYEVTDYSPAHYKKKIPNSAPHADHNPLRSYIIK
jgi:hypothetical protein